MSNATQRTCNNHQEMSFLGCVSGVTKEGTLRQAAIFSCRIRFLNDA